MLDAAERLLARGPDALSMRALGDALQISAMTPYGHFASKAEVLAALRGRGFVRLANILTDALASATECRLQAMGRAYAEFAARHKPLFAVMFDGEITGPAGAGDLLPIFERLADCLVDGSMVASPTRGEVALMVWTAMHGVVTLELLASSWGRPLRTREAALGALARGLAEPVSSRFPAD